MPLVGPPDDIYQGRTPDGVRADYCVRPAYRRDPASATVRLSWGERAQWAAFILIAITITVHIAIAAFRGHGG